MVAPPEDSGPARMTIELKVNCTTGCGGQVVDTMSRTFVATLSKETKNAITADGNMPTPHCDAGVCSSDYTFKFPVLVDCNKLLRDGAGAGKVGNFATNALDKLGAKNQLMASQIESKVKEAVSKQMAETAGGLAAELQSCKVIVN